MAKASPVINLEEQVNKYLEDPRIKDCVSRAHKIKESGKEFSDVIDAEGNQYVDLVQEGGGVLGIALVGYTYIMEQAGIRFFSLAGTSAGAINTLMLTATGKLEEAKSKKILEILESQNLFEFVDGSKSIRNFIQAYINKKPFFILVMKGLLASPSMFKSLFSRLGLNPGDKFEEWVTNTLSGFGIDKIDTLLSGRKDIPISLAHRDGDEVSWIKPKEAGLVLIASDITTQTKVQFPAMAKLYWSEPGLINPAKLVRASMSIPFFFRPMIVKNIPEEGMNESHLWENEVGYDGIVPHEVKFVDGGLLSNFPINVFHLASGVPSRPTFGAKLSALRKKQNKTKNLFQFSGSMLGTVRHLYDFDFIFKNPDYHQLITSIDPNEEEYNWLDFNMPLDKKIDLFEVGARKALEFLEGFDWNAYKKSRS